MEIIVAFNAALGAGLALVLIWWLRRTRSAGTVASWSFFVLAASTSFCAGAAALFRPIEWFESPALHLIFTLVFLYLSYLGWRRLRQEELSYKSRLLADSDAEANAIGRPATTARGLLSALQETDPATVRHSQRVAELAVLIARELKMSRAAVEEVRASALLHDVGKIGVRSSVLNKRRRLTDEEWREVKDHTWLGQLILKRAKDMRPVGHNVLYHHEKYDGTGYPVGLQGEEIPLIARIVAVADTFDTITFGRPYQAPRDETAAVDELLEHAGTQFDPAVVMAFLRALRTGRRKGLLALEAG